MQHDIPTKFPVTAPSRKDRKNIEQRADFSGCRWFFFSDDYGFETNFVSIVIPKLLVLNLAYHFFLWESCNKFIKNMAYFEHLQERGDCKHNLAYNKKKNYLLFF